MIFAQRKGADLKAEEIFRKIKLEDSIGKRKSSLIYNEDPFGSKKIVTMDDIKKQRAHLNGHLVRNGDFKLTCSDYLSEIYEEYLRMYQLAYEAAKSGKIMRTQTSQRAISSINFLDWVYECKSNLDWVRKDLKKQLKHAKISKEMWDFHEEIRRRSVEYCVRYINASKASQISMV